MALKPSRAWATTRPQANNYQNFLHKINGLSPGGSETRIATGNKMCMLLISIAETRWQCRLRREITVARFLVLPVRIPPGAWISVPWESCVLSGRGLCDGPITRLEESYRMWCVWVWSQNLKNEEAEIHGGLSSQKKNTGIIVIPQLLSEMWRKIVCALVPEVWIKYRQVY